MYRNGFRGQDEKFNFSWDAGRMQSRYGGVEGIIQIFANAFTEGLIYVTIAFGHSEITRESLHLAIRIQGIPW